MKRFAPLCVLLLAFAGISGCAKKSADSIVKKQIALTNEMADALEKNEPESTIAAFKTRQEELTKQMDSLKLSAEEKKKVMDQNKEPLEKANKRMLEAFFQRLDKEGLLDKDKAK